MYRQDRKNEEQNKQKAKQERRSKNIAEFLEKKKARKMGIKTKPAPRAGFEGKKKSFINE